MSKVNLRDGSIDHYKYKSNKQEIKKTVLILQYQARYHRGIKIGYKVKIKDNKR